MVALIGKPTGEYLITVADQFGNDVILIGEVTQPSVLAAEALVSEYNGFNVSCNEGADGSIEVTVQGGVSPYTYSWSSGGNTNLERNLSSGNYALSILDSYGC